MALQLQALRVCSEGHGCLAGRAPVLVQLSQRGNPIPARSHALSWQARTTRSAHATPASVTGQRPEAAHCQPTLQGHLIVPALATSASITAQQPEAAHCQPLEPSAVCPEQNAGSLLFHGTLCPSCKGLRQAPCSGCHGAGSLGRGGYSTRNPLDVRRIQGGRHRCSHRLRSSYVCGSYHSNFCPGRSLPSLSVPALALQAQNGLLWSAPLGGAISMSSRSREQAKMSSYSCSQPATGLHTSG